MTSEFPAAALTPVARTELRPAYVQIADQIRRVVADHDVATGTQLPVESELVERFAVSRMTVREGLRVLRLEGMIRAEHGVGVFIAAEGSRRLSTGTGGAQRPSEPGWREAVTLALRSPSWIGPVEPHEEVWASGMVGASADQLVKLILLVSDQPGRREDVHLYIDSTEANAAAASISAIEAAHSWLISVRGASAGADREASVDLLVTRTALDSTGRVLLVAQGVRSANWAVTTAETV